MWHMSRMCYTSHLGLTMLYSKEFVALLTCKVLYIANLSQRWSWRSPENGFNLLMAFIPSRIATTLNRSPWCNSPPSSPKARKYLVNHTKVTDMFHPTALSTNVLRIWTWGINSGRAYLLSFLEKSDMVVTERWFLPYSLHELDNLYPNFVATAVAHERLNPELD